MARSWANIRGDVFLLFDRSAVREAVRHNECALEPIHVPGAIQSHGALITVELNTFTVRQVSSNVFDVIGITAPELLGASLADAVGLSAITEIRDILEWKGFSSNPVGVVIGERSFDAIVHESDGLAVVEFEPRIPTHQNQSATPIYAAIHRLAGAATVDDLLAWSVREVRNLTKFDHVMVYKFHPDGHGEVVAEACATDMQPYLGHRFPASDIPIQARRLYLKKMSRVIADANTDVAQLLPPENPLTGEPVDLSLAELRAISPRHIQFMKNMGQSSTMSFSLVENGELIGMITCAHRAAIRIPYTLRQGYEVLARQIALQWGAMAQIDQLTRRDVIRGVRRGLNDSIDSGATFAEALTDGDLTIANLLDADACAVRVRGVSHVVGRSVDPQQVKRFLEYLAVTGERYLVSEALNFDRPDLARMLPAIAGLVVVPFGTPGNYLTWFRLEQVQSIEWLGGQVAGNRPTPLSPRRSFESWTESVSGRSRPWDPVELAEAAELSRDLDRALLAGA